MSLEVLFTNTNGCKIWVLRVASTRQREGSTRQRERGHALSKDRSDKWFWAGLGVKIGLLILLRKGQMKKQAAISRFRG